MYKEKSNMNKQTNTVQRSLFSLFLVSSCWVWIKKKKTKKMAINNYASSRYCMSPLHHHHHHRRSIDVVTKPFVLLRNYAPLVLVRSQTQKHEPSHTSSSAIDFLTLCHTLKVCSINTKFHPFIPYLIELYCIV